MTRPLITLFAFTIAVGGSPVQAQAQDPRFKVAFGPSVTTGTGDANIALTASIGYRFAERFAFEVDLTGSDDIARQFSDRGGSGAFGSNARTANNWESLFSSRAGRSMPYGGSSPFGADLLALAGLRSGGSMSGVSGLRAETDGQMVIGTIGFRYDLPVQSGRLRPYAGVGLGLVRTEQRFEASGAGLNRLVSDAMIRAGISPGSGVAMGRDSVSDSMTRTGMAASAGIGASLRVFRELSIDIDTRYFRLDGQRNLVRLGGGLSYRF